MSIPRICVFSQRINSESSRAAGSFKAPDAGDYPEATAIPSWRKAKKRQDPVVAHECRQCARIRPACPACLPVRPWRIRLSACGRPVEDPPVEGAGSKRWREPVEAVARRCGLVRQSHDPAERERATAEASRAGSRRTPATSFPPPFVLFVTFVVQVRFAPQRASPE